MMHHEAVPLGEDFGDTTAMAKAPICLIA